MGRTQTPAPEIQAPAPPLSEHRAGRPPATIMAARPAGDGRWNGPLPAYAAADSCQDTVTAPLAGGCTSSKKALATYRAGSICAVQRLPESPGNASRPDDGMIIGFAPTADARNPPASSNDDGDVDLDIACRTRAGRPGAMFDFASGQADPSILCRWRSRLPDAGTRRRSKRSTTHLI